MKTFLLFAFSLTTALTQVAEARDQEQVKHPNKRSAPPNQVTAVMKTPQFQNSVNTKRNYRYTPPNQAPRVNRVQPSVGQNHLQSNHRNRSAEWNSAPRVNRLQPSVNQNHLQSSYRNRNSDWNRNSNPRTPALTGQTNVNRSNWEHNNGNKRHWQNRNNSFSWEEARRSRHRNHHDRNWWNSRYHRFVLFGGGYYYWDNYYWYPAYGYDPAYNTYSYEEPIYGPREMDLSQTISSVQTELQRLGYYRYAVDGTMGPATRAAIANYQRDNGLAITSAIDGPTLESLRLE